jgi:hypothetical protein
MGQVSKLNPYSEIRTVEALVRGQRQILFCYHIATRSDIELDHLQADFLNTTHIW